MYAIIQTGGKQYRVAEGEILRVELLEAEPKAKVTFDQVLLVDQNGDMMLLNDVAQNMIASFDGLRFVNGRLHAADDIEDRHLQQIIRKCASRASRPKGGMTHGS